MSTKQRIEPGLGQESVWDYPRPPALEKVGQRVTVTFAGRTIADSEDAYRVLETSHPPTIYIPPAGLDMDCLREATGGSNCEWKGRASYYDLVVGDRVSENAGWFYKSPVKRFADLRDHVCFYPSRVDECTVGGEVVQAQEGDFYGGWITSKVVGPFKGAPGTWGW